MAILLSVSVNTISIIRTTSGVGGHQGHGRHEGDEDAGQEAHDQEELRDEQHTEVRNTRVNLRILLLY